MSNVSQVVPFLRVRDLEASLRFYLDGLGFTKTREWIDDGKLRWCWLDLGGAALMLQEDARAAGGGISLYFMCDDALQIYRDLKERGVDAKRPFVGNGLWVTSLSDPDGYHLAFESPTDAPEESEYSA